MTAPVHVIVSVTINNDVQPNFFILAAKMVHLSQSEVVCKVIRVSLQLLLLNTFSFERIVQCSEKLCYIHIVNTIRLP